MSVASASVRRKRVRYVLIIPCWALLVVVTKGMLRVVTAFGPVFSNHVWSII